MRESVFGRFPKGLIDDYCPWLRKRGIGTNYAGFENDPIVTSCLAHCKETRCYFDLDTRGRVQMYERAFPASLPEPLDRHRPIGGEILNHVLFGQFSVRRTESHTPEAEDNTVLPNQF